MKPRDIRILFTIKDTEHQKVTLKEALIETFGKHHLEGLTMDVVDASKRVARRRRRVRK